MSRLEGTLTIRLESEQDRSLLAKLGDTNIKLTTLGAHEKFVIKKITLSAEEDGAYSVEGIMADAKEKQFSFKLTYYVASRTGWIFNKDPYTEPQA